jgi:hypothetical protein
LKKLNGRLGELLPFIPGAKKLLYDLGNFVVTGLGLCVLENIFVEPDRLVPDVL